MTPEMSLADDVLSAADRDRPSLQELADSLHDAEFASLIVGEGEPVPLPSTAIRALARLASLMVGADYVQIQPFSSYLTTQQAADFIGISRPTLIKLLGDGEDQIPFVTPGPEGSHRRVRYVDLVRFRRRLAAKAADAGREELAAGEAEFLRSGREKQPASPSASASPAAPRPAATVTEGIRPKRISTTVNGVRHTDEVEPRMLLVYYLRDVLGLTGTHVGCDTSQCGACTILVNGSAVKSCTMFAVQADGASLLTIEGMATDGKLHPIQQAFWDEHGLQCGYCTPGFIMAAQYLLEQNPNPTDDEIRRGIEGNLCRCTGYVNIVNSIRSASRYMHGTKARVGAKSSVPGG